MFACVCSVCRTRSGIYNRGRGDRGQNSGYILGAEQREGEVR